MSHTPRLPDPDKWMSANKVERSTQRPLVDPRFRAHYGIATPPPSTGRKRAASSSARPAPSAAKRRALADVTPTAPQRNLHSLFTPPTTGLKGKGLVKAKVIKDTEPEDEDEDEDEDDIVVVENPKSLRGALPSSLPRRRSPLYDPEPEPEHFPEETLPTPHPSSSQYPMTQVPDAVLARHRKMFAGDDGAPAPLSPWRVAAGGVDSDEEMEHARVQRKYTEARREEDRAARLLAQKERAHDVVSAQAVARAEAARERRALGTTKSLAHLSSEDPAEGYALRRHSSVVEGPVSDAEWKSSTSGKTCKRTVLPAMPKRQVPKMSTPATPRRRSPAPHHKVTPPKSRTPQKYGGQQETLFELPAPPPRPCFAPARSPVASRGWKPVEMEPETLMTWSMGGATLPPDSEPQESTHFTVAEPESLRARDVPEDIEDFDDNESIAASVLSDSFPHLLESTPSPLRKPAAAVSPGRTPRAAPPPSPFTTARHPSPDTIPSSLPEGSESYPPSSPPSPPPKLIRRTERPFPKPIGLFSSISDAEPAHSRPVSALSEHPSHSHSSRSSSRVVKKTQSRLEQFGYLPERRAAAEFDTAFSDEDDLDFGPEEPLFERPAGSVPDAPPHPHLLAAGRREVARRDAAAMERHRAQASSSKRPSSRASAHSLPSSDFEIPHMPSNWEPSDASSLDVDADGDGSDAPRISAATREWWDRLGERDGPDA